ncbi:Zn(2)-C6 fungal-type DNA-binding domain [Phaffia rhodozyma]|uniref:Zn(2)-C6 fungal-type DNA-binding domain n=1 Tax=Phaffia rhodozyma TaxID=264483 RepID=A0A0F7SLS5_PHARH|nr:Zn(2)-C6 fungal-type DNA-binding domain [Phaffia rhodozyma]
MGLVLDNLPLSSGVYPASVMSPGPLVLDSPDAEAGPGSNDHSLNNEDEDEDERPRKRIRLACVACKRRKIRCPGEPNGCQTCLHKGIVCEYIHTGMRRGPRRGFRSERLSKSPTSPDDQSTRRMSCISHSHNARVPLYNLEQPIRSPSKSPSISYSTVRRSSLHESASNESVPRRLSSSRQTDGNTLSQPPGPNKASQKARMQNNNPTQHPRRVNASFELPLHLQDQLLSLYFTHIHNVWPLIYKPSFHPATSPPLLLLAMLAAASVIPTASQPVLTPVEADLLFEEAQSTLSESSVSHIHSVQALLLFTHRQISRGMNTEAYGLSCQAIGMALELGLHTGMTSNSKRPDPIFEAEKETRSRVFWCCYVMDKTFSEETGRPHLLRGRTASVPFPSELQADEFELWPPPSVYIPQNLASSADRTPNIQRVRSRTISCFNATCRLAYLVELIFDIDAELDFAARGDMNELGLQNVDFGDEGGNLDNEQHCKKLVTRVAKGLNQWYADLDPDLKVDVQAPSCPPTHFVVNMMWYHSATILMHSRRMDSKPDSSGETGLFGTSHQLCNHAAESIVELLACLDKFDVLTPSSSDVLHMLSHAAVFHAYNTAVQTPDAASSAEINFQKCCLWLNEIGSFWAPASAHRLFFDGLVKGGKELAAVNRRNRVPSERNSPRSLPPLMAVIPTSFARESSQAALENDISEINASSSHSSTYVTDIFKARTHFWGELIPNASGGSKTLFAPSSLVDTSTTASLPEMASPERGASGEGVDGFNAEPQNQFSTYLNSLDATDPSNLLAQFILDSSSGSWDAPQLDLDQR